MTRAFIFVLAALAGTASAQPAPQPPPAPPPPPTPIQPAPGADPVAPPIPAGPPVRPEAPAQEADKPHGVAGFDKGFYVRGADGRYTLKLTGRVQPFYNWARTAAATGDAQYKNNFEIRRARLTLEGNIHTRSLLYKMQSDFGKGFLSLKDFHVDLELAKDVWLRAGQWKRPFSRQQINSSGRLEVADRSITDKAFGAGRDIGIAVRNDYEKSPELEWIVGVFNGTGDGSVFSGTADPMTGGVTDGKFTNVPAKFKPAVVARVGINRNGIKGYSEADLEGGPLRWGAAASLWNEADFDHDDKSSQKLELDYIVKVSGLSSTGGLYIMSDQAGNSFTDADLSFVGFHVQNGFMVDAHWQAVVRYAFVDSRLDDTKDQQELSLGGNFFAYGHDAKLAGAIRFTKLGDAGFGDAILFELGANVGF